MYKKANALYFSATGVTGKVVKEIAKNLAVDFTNYNITFPKSREKSIKFTDEDIVVIGVPVYAGRIPKLVSDYFEKVSGDNTLAIFVAVYGNREYEDALVELKDLFEAKGFIGVAACSFIGEHSYTSQVATGRPDEMDLEIAKDFTEKIKAKLDRTKSREELEFFFVKGNVPYRDRKDFPQMTPDTDDSCIDCEICAKFCPTGAISFQDFSDIDPTKCIACCSCIKRCPVDSKSMNNEFFNTIKEKLINSCKETRKEPELFM